MEQPFEPVLQNQAGTTEEVASDNKAILETDHEKMQNVVIQKIDEFVSLTATDPQERTKLLPYYVDEKYKRFKQTGNVAEIKEAILKQRLVLDATKGNANNFPNSSIGSGSCSRSSMSGWERRRSYKSPSRLQRKRCDGPLPTTDTCLRGRATLEPSS